MREQRAASNKVAHTVASRAQVRVLCPECFAPGSPRTSDVAQIRRAEDHRIPRLGSLRNADAEHPPSCFLPRFSVHGFPSCLGTRCAEVGMTGLGLRAGARRGQATGIWVQTAAVLCKQLPPTLGKDAPPSLILPPHAESHRGKKMKACLQTTLLNTEHWSQNSVLPATGRDVAQCTGGGVAGIWQWNANQPPLETTLE